MPKRAAVRTRLLLAGGIVSALFALFHLVLGWQIHHAAGLPTPARGLMLALNVGGTLFIIFLAYAFLFRGQDLVSTGLGRATLVAGAALYWSRAAEETFWFDPSAVIFVGCLFAGAIPAALLALGRREDGVVGPP